MPNKKPNAAPDSEELSGWQIFRTRLTAGLLLGATVTLVAGAAVHQSQNAAAEEEFTQDGFITKGRAHHMFFFGDKYHITTEIDDGKCTAEVYAGSRSNEFNVPQDTYSYTFGDDAAIARSVSSYRQFLKAYPDPCHALFPDRFPADR